MKNKSVLFVFLFILSIASIAKAANVPSLSITPVTGSNAANFTIIGADPNASVLLFYPSQSSVASTYIGSTNESGYLATNVNGGMLGIVSGSSIYVKVNGVASQSLLWPNFDNNSGNLSLSQTNVSLMPGQSSTVTASIGSGLTLSNNTSPSVAGASISGNQVTITAFNMGMTTITICAQNIGCSPVTVSVQSSGSTAGISLNPNSATITVGQSQSVAISGAGNYYVSSNSSPNVASAALNGSTLILGGTNAGTTIISICSSGTNTSSCSAVNVTVNAATVSPTPTVSGLNLSPGSVTVKIGELQTVTISGGVGSYFVSNNSGPQSVSANITNSQTLTLTGLAFGGANITVCSLGGSPCGSLYAYVPAGTVVTQTNTATPMVSSFTVSSSNTTGNFVGNGSVLVISFSANQPITSPTVMIGGKSLPVNGAGSGPYSLTYTVSSAEQIPIPVKIIVANGSGASSQSSFSVGGMSSTVTTNTSTGASPSSSVGSLFTTYLKLNSIGAEVKSLQERLKSLGFFSGPLTGKFGSLTEAAVKKYQTAHALDAIGVVGPATRALLNSGK